VKDGQKIRLARLGDAGEMGGPSGDLYVKVKVRPHPVLSRRGNDILMEVPVTVGEAIAGATVSIPTPSGGSAEVRIPPGTSSGQTLRLRGLGVAPRAGGEPGDLLVRILVKVPKGGGDAAADLARQIDRFYAESPRKDLRL
jgi:DnaJ-class molecular chaperone